MIEINGSYGEGGGAVLRITTGLSALTSKPVHITNIRSGRPKPGLMSQHLNAVKAVADLSGASVNGLELGSTELFFNPKKLKGGEFKVDIGTAGSITLILQAFMIPAIFAENPVKITIIGGTDVKWSPSIDYLINITLPILNLMGYNTKHKLIQRGHYPQGGGIFSLEIDPVNKLKPLKLCELNFNYINGISHTTKLPRHIALRQAKSAKELLLKAGYNSKIKIDHSQNAVGPGSGILLWTNGKPSIGGSSIGELGKKAEIVGFEAANDILYNISRNSAVDRYMGDQIIPYLAIAGNSKIKTSELTQHAVTNIHITEKFIDKKFHVKGSIGKPAIISC